MSYTLVKMSDDYKSAQHKEFLMDSASDAISLPGASECAPGSTAETAGGTKLIMTPSGSWAIVQSGGDTNVITITSGGATLLYSSEITAASTDTAGDPLFDVTCKLPDTTTYKMVYAVVEDVAGIRSGYFYRTETIVDLIDGFDTKDSKMVYVSVGTSGGYMSSKICYGDNSAYGIFISSYRTDTDTLRIYARYGSASGIIDGTYSIRVYAIADPDV